MQYVNLGRAGLKVSRLCLGCMSYGTPKWREWVLDEDASRPYFKRALEMGINFFDTADVYSIGATKPHHLDDALAALEVKLSADEMKYLEELYVPHPVLGHN